jgi:hypothetical protein
VEHGTPSDVRWAVRTYGFDRFHEFFRDVGHLHAAVGDDRHAGALDCRPALDERLKLRHTELESEPTLSSYARRSGCSIRTGSPRRA